MRPPLTLGLGLLLALAAAPAAAAQAPEGTFKITYISAPGNTNFSVAILKIENKDGKPEANLVAATGPFASATLKTFRVENGILTAALQAKVGEVSFEGRLTPKGDNAALGSFGTATLLFPAVLARTAETELTAKTASTPIEADGGLKKLRDMQLEMGKVRTQLLMTKDAEEQKKLFAELNRLGAELTREQPGLLREALTKHQGKPVALGIRQQLIRTATADTAAADLKNWAAEAAKAAKLYGPRLEFATNKDVVTALLKGKLAGDAVEYARAAEKGLTKATPVAAQVEVLSLLARALRESGKQAEAKDVQARVDRVEEALDKEYLATVPPFKPGRFDGRKGQSTRVAVVELFTGAQCPPCVAADVAFDAVEATYKTTDVVLIQYHVHIPGPDPLTNADTEARMKYYAVRSAPSVFFSGKAPEPKTPAASGGPMAGAEKKYAAYRDRIEPILETPAGATLKASAKRQGDKIDISADVSDLIKTGDDVRLRLLLVEEKIRYVGSNKIRFHHQVVRAMPGGVEGTALTQKNTKVRRSVDVAELRTQLTKYLDDYAAKRPFPNANRPLDLGHLRVIALVQDDATKEILQATQVEVTSGK